MTSPFLNRTRLASLIGAALLVISVAATAQNTARNLVLQQDARPVAAQEQRVALVIGNNAYRDAPLSNPVNDARAMADALRTAGFAVTLRTDISQRDFLVALRQFGDALRRGGVGVFYFAGHGMQIKGRNYLIPADAVIEREDEVAYAAVDAQAVLDKMETAGNGANLMILDACRNNPFARSFRSSTAGLAQMEAPVGTLVAFATAPGAVASDGQGGNGLYTQHLLGAMAKPGAKVEDVFKQTRSAVRQASQGKQVPWESTSLEGDFYFVPVRPAPAAPATPAPTTAVDAARTVEDAFWASVADSRDPADLRAFIKRYPQGAYAALAGERLAALEPATMPGQLQPPSSAANPISQPLPVNLPPGARDDASRAEHDRVSAELLAALRQPASAAQQPPSASSRPVVPARANAFGYTVGDKWNYQVVDLYKGEVVRNFAVNVERIESDGAWMSGSMKFDEAGRLTGYRNDNGELREAKPHYPLCWPGMKVGEVVQLAYEEMRTSATGSTWLNRNHSEARVLRRERIRVPAGEFDTLRVEIKGEIKPVGRPGYGSFIWTIWYAPELHTSVAREEEYYWNGKINDRVRHELTSLHLVNHPDFR